MSSSKVSIARINEDIQRVMADLLRSIKDPRINQGMVSVTAVDTTSDLRYSRVYLSVLGLESEKEFMKGLKSASGYLRRELGSALGLRYTPELVFHLDRSIERGAHISKMLSELKPAGQSSPEDGEEKKDGGADNDGD